MYALTLVASDTTLPITEKHIQCIRNFIGLDIEYKWIEPSKAILCLVPVFPKALAVELKTLLALDKIDFFLCKSISQQIKLLLCDMDSTIIDGETLDDLSASMGVQDSVAAITKQAMAGELDFREALQMRVALLKGMPYDAVRHEIASLCYNKGAKKLIHSMVQSGVICVLISGGFTCFTKAVAKELGFHHHHGNELAFTDGYATGQIVEPVLNSEAKLNFLYHYKKKYDLQSDEILAVGDGANDLPMLEAAGVGVGFRPKPYLEKRVVNAIRYGGLDTLLYIQQ